MLWGLWTLPAAGQSYPSFPPPGMSYSATNGNLTLQNLTLESVTGIVLCDGSAALCAPATSSNVVALWSGTVSTSNYLRSDGQLAAPLVTAPAGTNGEVQYNNAGVFGGNTGFTYDGSGDVTASGTVTGNLFSGSGASLTALNASSISSGTLSNSRLSGVALLASANVFTAAQAISSTAGASLLEFDNAGAHVADMCLNTNASSSAACLLGGDLPGDLSMRAGAGDTVHLADANGADFDDASASTFTFHQTTVSAPSVTSAPWTNASNLTSGTLSNSRLSGVALLSSSNAFTGATQALNPSGTAIWTATAGSATTSANYNALSFDGSFAAMCISETVGACNGLSSIADGMVLRSTGSIEMDSNGVANTASISNTVANFAGTVEQGGTAVCLSSGTNCPAQTFGKVSMILTSAGTGTPTVTTCNRCSSPTASRASTGLWEINTGVTLTTGMVVLCNLDSGGPVSGTALFIYGGAATPIADDVTIAFFNTSGIAADPSSSVEVSCAVGL
jgi:hypothetical protein